MPNCAKLLSIPVLLLWSISATAAEPVALVPSGTPLFADHDPEAEAGANVSGATCFAEGDCILVADEMIAMQQIALDPDGSPPTYAPGRTYGLFFEDQCTDLSERDDCEEVDLEAIASRDRQVLVTGSMGNRSGSGKRARDRWFLAQFEITETGEPKSGSLVLQSRRALLKELYNAHPELEPYIELPLQCGGVNVEGMAVLSDQIYFGLRGPAVLDKGTAYVLQSPDSALTADKKTEMPETMLHTLVFRQDDGKPIRGIGIRALEPLGDRLLIATGNAGVSAPSTPARREDILERCAAVPGGQALPFVEGDTPLVPRIWIWDPASTDDPVEIARLDGRYADEKLEGIALLPGSSPQNGPIDLVLTIDGQNDVEALALLKGVKIPN